MIHLIQGLTWNPHNATLIHAHVGTFICPSDGGPLSETGNNYRASLGVGPNLLTSLYHPDSANGMFPLKASVPLAAIVDGLSHTSAMSERIRGSGTGRGSSATTLTPGRDSYQSIGGFLYDADDWRMTCEVSALQGGVYGGYGFAGKRWYIASSHLTLYDHVLVPNDAIPDCAGSAQGVGDAVATARSAHPGGVNVLFGDGSIRFVASTVQVNVWRAFGSRKGGELVD
jgi:prepilin-type processing-associated H-X9-DG protein